MLDDLQKKKLAHYFKLWDVNQDGVLEFDEFFTLTKRIARLKGYEPDSLEYQQLYDDTVHRWTKILAHAGEKPDGKLTLSEWLGYSLAHIEHVRQYGLDKTTRLMIRFIFNLVDANHDGVLDPAEWATFLEIIGVNEDPGTHLQRLDTTDRGHLTLTDFEQLYYQFFFEDNPAAPGNYLFGLLD